MDDDDDYFTPATNTSRRLAMLFNSDEPSSGGTITGHHADPTAQFRFVAPKQPRPGRSNSNISNSSRDGQEVLLEVIFSLVPQGGEKDGGARTPATCQVVGNAVRRNFTLIITQDKLEVFRAAIDSHLSLEVEEHSTLRVMSQGHSLTLLGDAQRIEAFVMQVAIYRGVCVEGPSHQDLCVGKGHVLEEGDVAKVSCTTHTITSTALRGDKVEELKAAKVTVSGGGWESHLAGATVDSHRLIFMPKQKDGKWLPATLYCDITVLKVRTKGGNKEKQTSGTPTPTRAPTLNGNSIANTKEQESHHHTLPSSDVSNSSSPAHTVTAQNGHLPESESHNTTQDASRKAALVSRMAQLGTPLLPLMPGAKGTPPHPSEVTPETTSIEPTKPLETERTESQPPTTTEQPATTFTSPPTPIHSTAITTTTTATITSDVTPLTTTTAPSTVPTTSITTTPIAPVLNQSQSLTVDSTLALSICQLGTSLTRISDRVDLLITKVDKGEAAATTVGRGPCIPASSSPPTSDPEALMSLASGLVAHNERLRSDVEALERKVKEGQTSIASLLAMNAELLEEKRDMLRRDELRKREEKEENKMKEVKEGVKKEEGNKMEGKKKDDADEVTKEDEKKEDEAKKENEEQEKKNHYTDEVKKEEAKKENEEYKEDSKDKEEVEDSQVENQNEGDVQGITPHQVKSIIKSTLSGLFRLLSNDFSDEEQQYTRSQILQTVRSGLEVAYSTMMDNLEEIVRTDEGRGEEDEHEEEEEENQKSREQDEERGGNSDSDCE